MESSDIVPGVGDLVLPAYYRLSRSDGKNHGVIVRRDGIFYDILWGGKDVPEEYWTTDDFYVVKCESEAR